MPGIAGKVKKLPRQVRRNGIQSANKQVEAKAEQFVIRQRPPALDLRLHAIGDDIIPRILLAIFNYGFEIGDHVVRRPQQRLYIRRMEQLTRPIQELLHLRLGKAHQFKEHLDGKFESEFLEEINFALGPESLNIAARIFTALGIHPIGHFWRKHRIKESAEGGIKRRIRFQRQEASGGGKGGVEKGKNRG